MVDELFVEVGDRYDTKNKYINSSIDGIIRKVDDLLKENEVTKRLIDDYNKTIKDLEVQYNKLNEEHELIRKSIALLQKISDERNEKSRCDIQELINSALSSIFPERKYSLIIDEYSHGTRKHMRVVLADEENTRDLKNAHGTGIKQIISFLFNISLIVFKGASRIMLLDETLASISNEKATTMSDIMVSLSKSNNFQFLIVDHNDLLWSNKEITVIRLARDDERGLYIEEIRKGQKENEVE